jgi:hypothetical protein
MKLTIRLQHVPGLKCMELHFRGLYAMKTGHITRRQNGRGVTPIIHLRLVPRLRIRGAIPSLTRTSGWCGV